MDPTRNQPVRLTDRGTMKAFNFQLLVSGIVTSTCALASASMPGTSQEMCVYSEPKYRAYEVASIQSYRQCLAAIKNPQRQTPQKNLDAKVPRDRQYVVCYRGGQPNCYLPQLAEKCVQGQPTAEGYYSCADLLERYPILTELMADNINDKQNQKRVDEVIKAETIKCQQKYAQGFGLTQEKCRKSIWVVTP